MLIATSLEHYNFPRALTSSPKYLPSVSSVWQRIFSEGQAQAARRQKVQSDDAKECDQNLFSCFQNNVPCLKCLNCQKIKRLNAKLVTIPLGKASRGLRR